MAKTKKRLTPAAKYILDNLAELEELSKGGHSMEAIALHFGVSRSTFYEYAAAWPEISDAIRKGKSVLIRDVKSALTKKALGYDYEEIKTYIKKDGGKEIKTVEKTQKHQPPDVAACHLILKNLDDEWHNDDAATLRHKAEELEIKKQKAEADQW